MFTADVFTLWCICMRMFWLWLVLMLYWIVFVSNSCWHWLLVLPHDAAIRDAGMLLCYSEIWMWEHGELSFIFLYYLFKQHKSDSSSSLNRNVRSNTWNTCLTIDIQTILKWCNHLCFLRILICSYWTSCQWFTVHVSLSTVCKWLSILDLLLSILVLFSIWNQWICYWPYDSWI